MYVPTLPSDTHTLTGPWSRLQPHSQNPPDGDLAGEDLLPLRLGLASQVCQGWVKRQGRLFCMVCVLKASAVKRQLVGSWFQGPLAELGTAVPLGPSWCQRGIGYKDWCLSLRAKTF